MTSESIIKWKVYCNTEGAYVDGFLDDTYDSPTVCFNNNNHTIDTSKTKYIEKIFKNHTREIIKWKIYCDTEKAYTYGYSDEIEPPSYCFNNQDHVVSTHPILLEKIYNNNQRIQEESRETGGHFKCYGYKIDCPTGTSTHDYTYDNPISALSISFVTTSDHQDDELSVLVGPDTTIGSLTVGVTIGVTSFNVSDTVIEHAKVGYNISLYDGVNTDDLGTITYVDKINSTITTTNGTSYGFSAASPTYVRITVTVVDSFIFGFPGRYEIGKDKIGGSYVPTGTIIRVKYVNNGGTSKTFYPKIEMLY